MKRKRKEHRSLDSILFENDGELEYFDVLNLLPLSNVRLEIEEVDARNNNVIRERDKDQLFDVTSYNSDRESTKEFLPSIGSNETDEEKSKSQEDEGRDPGKGFWVELVSPSKQEKKDFWERIGSQEERKQERKEKIKEEKALEELKVIHDSELSVEPLGELERSQDLQFSQERTFSQEPKSLKNLKSPEAKRSQSDKYRANVAVVTPCEEEKIKVEEVEDVRSIWISDEEPEDMSRRPQVIKVVDNDITKRLNKNYDSIKKNDSKENGMESSKDSPDPESGKRGSIESARIFFEKKSSEKKALKNAQVEGRFERIVKGTSNILGKACNAVKGTLGFEARSESSDLGLGSEIGSDTRRQSVDDGISIENTVPTENGVSRIHTENLEMIETIEKDELGRKTSLTRSRSCVDSIDCQDEPEFDHVRYKIVKSNHFGKSIFSTSKGDVTYEGLMKYLRKYSFQELLLDNNVVIIEPVRAANVERKSSMNNKSKSLPTCRVSGAVQKKTEPADSKRDHFDEKSRTCPRQPSLRKHFFYHPIRVNKELIDDELPDPDTVKNVRKMFEETLKVKKKLSRDGNVDCKAKRSLSMKDISVKDVEVEDLTLEKQFTEEEKNQETR